jgi:hypothetical protein
MHSEALRLATTVAIIVHDGGKNHSILNHLGIKDKIDWHASNDDVTGISAVMQRSTPLVKLDNTPDGPDFVPLCSYVKNRDVLIGSRTLSFENWWTKDVIFSDSGKTLSRRDLVLTLRNQEGGSHFDEEVRHPYYGALKEQVFMVFPGAPLSNLPAAGVQSVRNLALASMRQVAEEVRISLGIYDAERNGPEADGTLRIII